MQFKSVKRLIKPLIAKGHYWQSVSINGTEAKPRFYLSDVQWVLLLVGSLVLFRLTNGISKDIVGYVMSAFSISVSLFMSLLISIFDKFEKTEFNNKQRTEEEYVRLVQKKNFFKRFISITSYLVVLSIVIIILCSLTYLFNLSDRQIKTSAFTMDFKSIDLWLTIKNGSILIYRIVLNYFLLNYLFLTFFITGSAYEYYMSEMDRNKLSQNT